MSDATNFCPALPEPSDAFCPTLPQPYEALVREALAAAERSAYEETVESVTMVPGPSVIANHAAAEAEHALRAALREVLEKSLHTSS